MKGWVYIPKNLGQEKQLIIKASTLQQREGVKETKIYTSSFTMSPALSSSDQSAKN